MFQISLAILILLAMFQPQEVWAQKASPQANKVKKPPVRRAVRPGSSDIRIDAKIVVKRNGQVIPQKGGVKWDFFEATKEAKVLVAQLILVPPAGIKIKEMSGPHLISKPSWIRADAVMLALGAINTDITVKLDGGGQEVWKAEIQFSKTAFRMRGCAEAGLKVVSANTSTPNVFFAADCTVKEDRVIFNPSVPGDLEWDVTTIFETDGKGERWKIFEISRNNLVAGDDVVATLGFVWQGKKTSFVVMQNRGKVSDSMEQAKKKRNETRARLDFGMTQFGSKTPVAETSSTSPFLAGDVLTKELLWGLRAAAGGRYVFPIAKGSSVSFYGGAGKIFGPMDEGSSNFGLFGEYVVLNQNQEVSGKTIGFQHSQVGVAAMWLKMMASGSELKASLRYNGIGGTSQGLGLDVAYEGLFGSSSTWGLVLRYASQSAKSSGGTSTFGQTSLGGTLSF